MIFDSLAMPQVRLKSAVDVVAPFLLAWCKRPMVGAGHKPLAELVLGYTHDCNNGLYAAGFGCSNVVLFGCVHKETRCV